MTFVSGLSISHGAFDDDGVFGTITYTCFSVAYKPKVPEHTNRDQMNLLIPSPAPPETHSLRHIFHTCHIVFRVLFQSFFMVGKASVSLRA